MGLGRQLPRTEASPPMPQIAFKALSAIGWVLPQKLLAFLVGARELNTQRGLCVSQTVSPPLPASDQVVAPAQEGPSPLPTRATGYSRRASKRTDAAG